jgi:eukaryotic-like serine/threonine-protein kinase
MGDASSSVRTAEPSPLTHPDGERGGQAPAPAMHSADVPDDQPTVVTNRPPLPSVLVGDSTSRILLGRIMPGDRLGHYALEQYVGGGGMGRVFRATDTRLARPVAIKVLTPEQAADRDTLLRFQNEAQSAARLDHENIARVYYVGEDHDLHYIVFEFVEGPNVRELVQRRGPLPWRR